MEPVAARGRRIVIHPSDRAQNQLGYLVSYPPGFQEGDGRRWPVICFLHGDGEAAPMDIGRAMGRHGPLKAGNQAAAIDRFIVVAPQIAERGNPDQWEQHAPEVLRIVRSIPERDPGRTFLTGFSYGGNGVFTISDASPDNFWAAVWPVDPTTFAGGYRSGRIWLSMGPESRNLTGAGLPNPLSKIPGRAANTPPPRHMVIADEGLIGPQPGGDSAHVRTATLAYSGDQVYDWLSPP